MPTASRPASAVRRSSQVYVSVPPSSYSRPSTISRTDSMSSSESPSFSSLKENTPLRPTRTNSELTSMTTLSTLSTKSNKRKHAEDTDLPLPEGIPEVKTSKAKKPRLSSNAVATKAARGATQAKGSAKSKAGSNRKHEQKDNSEEFPNGFFYCHQCTKKRDVSCKWQWSIIISVVGYGSHADVSFLLRYLVALQCTIKDDSKAAKGQCRFKYCRECLKNRYQEDMDDILSGESTPLTKKEKAKHIANAGYYYEYEVLFQSFCYRAYQKNFRCPRCRDECNCSSCRKAKGLEPTG